MTRTSHAIMAWSTVCIFAATPGWAQQGADKSCRASVMTFNIRYNNPNDGADAWPHRKDMVAQLIKQHADIAGLQEAQLDQIQDLEERLPDFAWYGVGRDDGKQAGEYCPIFYRRDRFQLENKYSRWLSETPNVPGSKSWDTAITRLVTVVQLKDRQTGVKFFCLNTHFDHRGTLARENSARLIRQFVRPVAARAPIIVTGDFNCTPDRKPYAILTATEETSSSPLLLDGRTSTKQLPEGPNSTWCGFREIVPERRIDFIFVGPSINVNRHVTIGDRINGRFPSDHLPVVVELDFPADK